MCLQLKHLLGLLHPKASVITQADRPSLIVGCGAVGRNPGCNESSDTWREFSAAACHRSDCENLSCGGDAAFFQRKYIVNEAL